MRKIAYFVSGLVTWKAMLSLKSHTIDGHIFHKES